MDPERTRRGAWRGAFSGTGIIHGFENTWGPWWIPDEDQEGMKYLLTLKDFFTNTVEFHRFKPDPRIIDQSVRYKFGTKPLCMSTGQGDAVLLYLPVGGSVTLNLPNAGEFESLWYDPRTGEVSKAQKEIGKGKAKFQAESCHGSDWVLVLRKVG